MYQGNPGVRVRVGEIEMEYEEHGGGRPALRARARLHRLARRLARGAPAPRRRAAARSRSTCAATAAAPTPATTRGLHASTQLVADVARLPRRPRRRRASTSSATRWAASSRCASCSTTPERVASLILMDTAAEPDRARRAQVLRDRRQDRARAGHGGALPGHARRRRARPEPAARRWSARRAHRAPTRSGRASAQEPPMDPVAFAHARPDARASRGRRDRLGEIRCPTTVIVGAEDQPS